MLGISGRALLRQQSGRLPACVRPAWLAFAWIRPSLVSRWRPL